MKKIIKLVEIFTIITILLGTNVKAFTVDTTARASIVFDDKMPYHYEAEEKVNYKMLTYKGGKVLYTLNRNNDIVMTLFTDAESYLDSVCERILENGYPAKTYQELGVSNGNEAYFATQEAIYAYLENKDINKYIAENEEGERILACTKQILEKAKKEEVSFIEIDSEWQVDETDDSYMYKQYGISLDSKIDSVGIELENASNVKVTTQENGTVSMTKNGDIIKILVPKGMNQDFKVKLSYEREGLNLYKIYHSSNTSIKYLIEERGQVQKEKTFDVEFKTLAPIIISNYDKETNEPISRSVFSILDKSYKTIKENLITDEEGKVQSFLESGDYFLKQTEISEEYSISEGLVSFTVKGIENIDLNVYNAEVSKEEINRENTQINVTEETKEIVENDVTNVMNIHTTNIEKETIHETNETNFENINYFVNTTYLKNVNNITKENTYSNNIWKEVVTNKKVAGENKTTNMTRDEYMTYIDFVKMGNLEVPNLPVALKQ
ncbi:MAG: Cys-Gln thioester bond-forming surface protein [Clostridia bacterium]|nr:Cys-Gln thioester bond-forming surface protein [Clostridia bacterium]